jgi:hypothetical protein
MSPASLFHETPVSTPERHRRADVAGLDEPVDDAYREKYRRYTASIIDHIRSPGARSATLRLVPRATGGRRTRCRHDDWARRAPTCPRSGSAAWA